MDPVPGTWLCPTAADRARLLEAGPRVRVAKMWVTAAQSATAVAVAPWVGWWPAFFAACAMLQVSNVDQRIRAARRPEVVVACSFAFTYLTIVLAVQTSGGPTSPLLPLLALPTTLMANRLRRSVVMVAVTYELVMVLGATLALHRAATIHNPTMLLAMVTVIVGIAVFTLALSDTEMRLRTESRFDHLTGLLNRAALAPRFAEVRSQARVSGGPVSLVVFDLDHFKSVNDELGHDIGDAVLSEAALLLRRPLRGFDLLYRIGGEEFALVLPGVAAAEAAEIAERQRVSVADGCPGGIAATISGGVACAAGSDVSWETLYRDADTALRHAKRGGRNRISVFTAHLPLAA
jgi:diguanylate cyclase (GGDEF)-like protein